MNSVYALALPDKVGPIMSQLGRPFQLIVELVIAVKVA
jgi:hypothetical protein